jgi:hypothetical protein
VVTMTPPHSITCNKCGSAGNALTLNGDGVGWTGVGRYLSVCCYWQCCYCGEADKGSHNVT